MVYRILPWIMDELRENPLHVTLIDPDSQEPERASEIALCAAEGGTSFILVGGSRGVDINKMESTLTAIKESIDLPVVIFPASSDLISDKADALLFMSLMNSRNPRFTFGEAVKAAKLIRDTEIETISTGYVVVEPGMLVGEVGEVDLIRREDNDRAASYGITAQLLGMDIFYLEGGSGVDHPIPPDMIRTIKGEISIPLVVGGGIKTPALAREVVRAGADLVVTGTMVETETDIKRAVSSMVGSIREAGEERAG